MEDHFIAPSGTDVTDAFRMYLRPLRRDSDAHCTGKKPEGGTDGRQKQEGERTARWGCSSGFWLLTSGLPTGY
jgi:hypothetical protein